MSASSTPGPDDRESLSSREKEILARIEEDLVAVDPGLARRFAHRGPTLLPAWWPISFRSTAALLAGLLVLIVAASLMPASWSPALGLLAGLFAVAWILLCVHEQKRPE